MCLASIVKKQCDRFEKIQRHFTNQLKGFHNIPHKHRLEFVHEHCFKIKSIRTDLIIAYKCINSVINILPTNVGILVLHNNDCSGHAILQQKFPHTKIISL